MAEGHLRSPIVEYLRSSENLQAREMFTRLDDGMITVISLYEDIDVAEADVEVARQ